MAAFNSFNSLQTGRYVESKDAARFHASFSKFQFPSNGKVHGKMRFRAMPEELVVKFQFPSNGKVHGKYDGYSLPELFVRVFQFPSNGKVHGKQILFERKIQDIRFNSLQTGRYMESIRLYRKPPKEISFNSLQTGRYMESY